METLSGSFRKRSVSYTHLEYQTWISTKTYTVPKNSTVKDVFEKACRDAGLSWDNPSGNYVTGITAPKVYGGYKPVSYTHLDVYKRQVPAMAMEKLIRQHQILRL